MFSTVWDKFLSVFVFSPVIRCFEPVQPKNAMRTSAVNARGDYFYNMTITYVCGDNTRFWDGHRVKVIRCMANGEWNETLTSCEGVIG